MAEQEGDSGYRKRESLRSKFVAKYAKYSNSKQGIKCCACKGKKMSNKYTWHWTGFTFHVGCLPEDK